MQMRLALNVPGMTALHKAGLAGLYMTLQTLEDANQKISGLHWCLRPDEVILDWQDNLHGETFRNLIEESFWLDEQGFIRLRGLEHSRPPSTDQKVLLYTALLNTFLQFGPHRPTSAKKVLAYEVDEKPFFIKDFAPIKEFRHQFASGDFIDSNGMLKTSVEAAGWLYPGGGQRHVAYNSTKLTEPVENALALLYAPVGVIYFVVRSRSAGRKVRVAMIIPEVTDLAEYSSMRSIIATQNAFEMTATNASDAVLRMLALCKANQLGGDFSDFSDKDSFLCRVVTFGIVSWNEKQKSRTLTRSIMSGQLHGLDNYWKASSIFRNRWQKIQAKTDRHGKELEPERFFVSTSAAREFIAENIAQGRAWYENLSTFLRKEDVWSQIQYERKELNQMVQTATFDEESEHLFIRVCHESWRRRLGKLNERTQSSEAADFRNLVRRESERLRASLSRCKNADTLRETVVDFWSRSGRNEMLNEDVLRNLLPLFNEKNWKKTKDLALLALISYQPKDRKEAEALAVEMASEEDKDDE